MSGASLSVNLVPGVRICSERDCDNAVGFPPFKGNFCQQCTARMRSRRTDSAVSDATGRPTFLAGVPSSVAAHLLQQGPILPPPPPLPPQVRRFNFPGVYVGHYHKSPVAFPHHGQQSSTARIPTSVIANRSAFYTFNPHSEIPHASGLLVRADTVPAAELTINGLAQKQEYDPSSRKDHLCTRCRAIMPPHYIGDTCPTCRVEVAMLAEPACSLRTVEGLAGPFHSAVVSTENIAIDISKDVASMFSNSNDRDVGSDVDMEDLELSYPDVAETTPHLRPEPVHNPRTNIPSSTVSCATPSKRRKVSHPTVIDLTNSPPPPPRTNIKHFTPPEVSKPTRITSRSLRLCSSADCTGIVSITSSATRCLDCVRRDWMFKKATRSSKPGVRPSVQRTVSLVRQREVEQRKKSVTWADQIPQSIPSKDFTPLAGGALLSTQETRSPIVAHSDSTNLLPVQEGGGIVGDVVSEDHTNSEETTETLSDCVQTPQPTSMADRTDADTSIPFADESASSLRLSTTFTQVPESDEVDNASGTWVNEPIGRSSSHEVSGWDSDLTELSDEQEEMESQDGSSSEAEVINDRPSSAPSGLKIRIPARPAGVYSRKCASLKCHQLLSVGYRWKTCVLCRARSRDYQRRRQNLQGKHVRLDQELLEGQNTGTPLAKDLITDTITLKEHSIGLVPGARLCSIRNCTYITPPADEYHWKMCAVCRLRRREIRRQVKARPNQPTKMIDSTILKALAKMRKKTQTLGKGRCQSLDCGMLVDDSVSLNCKQCIARTIWLGGRSHSSISPTDRPRGPPPYHQYICFPALLKQFKKHLSGFLRTQSVFFLFKQPDSAKTKFAFDGEFSVVVPDFNVIDRKEEVDASALKLKREIEHVGRIRFSSKRLVSILDGGGISIRFCSIFPVPILQTVKDQVQDQTSIAKFGKDMQCELEIATLPDYSHRFIPGQRTIIRFRLLG